VTSAGLIRFNKWMMKPDHFPHSLALSAIHMLVSTVLCVFFYTLAPSMFPAMEETKGNRLGLMKWFLPIGGCFAVMLFGSNQAYMYSSVTFLQFMKEGNVMVVFLISCLFGLQQMNRMRMLVIVWVIAGSSLAISGDLRFSLPGFVFQGVSQLAECCRMIMGEFVLSGKKLDPLTYTMFVAPTCLVVLVLANLVHWHPGTLHDLQVWWPLLLCNALLAFLLNVCVAAVIKECSAVGFVLVGVAKDIFIVLFSCFCFGETVTKQQVTAFTITLFGICFWSLMKTMPHHPLVQLCERGLCMEPQVPSEMQGLVEKRV